MNPVAVQREVESPISYDYTSLMGKMCEHQFFGLDLIFEPILTLTFESHLNLSQIFESVFVPVPFEAKSIIFHNHTSLLDNGVEHNNSEFIFENRSFEGDNFSIRSYISITF